MSPAVSLATLVLLITERVSPTAYLSVLSCIFLSTLTAFLVLVCTWKIPIRGRLLQTLVLLLKLVLDLVATILAALKSSKRIPLDGNSEIFFEFWANSDKRLDGTGTKPLVNYILLIASSICITSLEVSLRSLNDMKQILILNCSTSTYGSRMKRSPRRVSGG